MAIADPILKINGKRIGFEPNTFKHTKGYPERKFFPNTVGDINTTEDLSTSIAMVSFSLRSTPDNEILFNEWVSLGSNNSISFSRGDLNTNVSNCAVENTNVEIESGSDSTFVVSFKGNPVVE